ncbi:ABC-type transporter [Podosphaera aphanis]|nr:ABC-type transporter [Podosphaera aphanis]
MDRKISLIGRVTSKSEIERCASSSKPESKIIAQTKKRHWHNQMNPFKWGKVPPVPDQRTVSREYDAGFFSILYFQWITPLMAVGYKRSLQENDIWTVNPNRMTKTMTERLQVSFKKRVTRGDKNPLLFALLDTFRTEFLIGGLCQLSACILLATSPFVLRYLIKFTEDAFNARPGGPPAPSVGIGLGLVFGITIMQMIQSLQTNHFIYRGMMVGGQARAVLISLIFEKAMKISGRAKATGRITGSQLDFKSDPKLGRKIRKPKDPQISDNEKGWANGKVMNLMSVDSHRVDQASALFHLIWTSPIICIITLALLTINISYSAITGFSLLVIGLPAMTLAIKVLFLRRKKINKITDQRISLTQEILQAVRFVKLFAWENAFLDQLQRIRKFEIRAIQIILAIRNAVYAVSLSLPIFASMLSFVTYSLTNHTLDSARVFSSLALFNSLRMPLNLFPLVMGQATDAWSSINRIQDYLLSEEIEGDSPIDSEAEKAIEIKNADFTWEPTIIQDMEPRENESIHLGKSEKQVLRKNSSERPVPSVKSESEGTLVERRKTFNLQNINFSVGHDELIAVIGGVGSGKSSLLAALAGDMRRTSGHLMIGATRAYCPQYSWIQNTTARNNLTFGKTWRKDWYNQVVDACALRPDFDMLPEGDATEIGERGITISGGQKQRLNIARAIYHDADLVLMDDPLSAVDAHVGRHIWDKAILRLMKNKARILVTHQLWVLSQCDRIIWMEEGQIRAIDTFENLMKDDSEFQALMRSTAMHQNEKKEINEEKLEAQIKEPKKVPKNVKLMQAEERSMDSVPWSVYLDYIRASGSLFNAAIALFFLLASQGANIATSLWLSWWTSDHYGFTTGVYIGTYAALGCIQAILTFAFAITITLMGTTASKKMLNSAVRRVLRAPMSFFDTTPLGRITNRFSRDVDVMDNELSDAIRVYLLMSVMIMSVLGLIITYFQSFAVALVPLTLLCILYSSYYRASAREIKRVESVLRSHVYAKFSEGLSGVACIRAYGLQHHFLNELQEAIDNMNSAYFLTFANQRWLSTRLDVVGNLLVFAMGILAVTSRFDISPSITGLVLSYILSIVQIIQLTVRQLAEVESGMNATERLHYYGTSLEEEAPLHTVEIRKTWPESGEIIFKNVQMRYRANLPLVLAGLNMQVRGGERIGIVGRTGAGKSSIMLALFRLMELSAGSITIDGIDISTIGLHSLRSRLAIIPQDPTLFKGTVRSNLDPFSEHTDLELSSALRQSNLVSSDQANEKNSSNLQLNDTVEDEGLNFSLGQRQLMALARALVRDSRIIICDEATSSVDMETDEKIQQTIAAAFKGRTLLCIAHRLKTIISYDRICVLDQGSIVELDTPRKLWESGGIFRSMCDNGGVSEEDFS